MYAIFKDGFVKEDNSIIDADRVYTTKSMLDALFRLNQFGEGHYLESGEIKPDGWESNDNIKRLNYGDKIVTLKTDN